VCRVAGVILVMQQRPAIAVDVLVVALVKIGERSVVASPELTPEHLRIALSHPRLI
jgi:hypothetical protein